MKLGGGGEVRVDLGIWEILRLRSKYIVRDFQGIKHCVENASKVCT